MNLNILSHFPAWQPVVRDTFDDADMNALIVGARVRSGDYFATIAMELDKVAQALSMARAPEAPELERLVSELLYVQQHYSVVRK